MLPLPAILHPFTLSDAQQQAALARGVDVAVTAGAGTGKTRTLVARYLALLAAGMPLRRIVAITFTRKAAREMRNRVRREIEAYLAAVELAAAERSRWQAHLNALDAARIGTIHNLCGEILRAHPAEAGIDPRFDVLDETQSTLLQQETVEAVLGWASAEPTMRPLLDLLRERDLQALTAALLQDRADAANVVETLPEATILATWETQLAAWQQAEWRRAEATPELIAARRILFTNQADQRDDKAEIQRRLALAALDGSDDEPWPARRQRLAGLGDIDLRGGSQRRWPGGKAQLDEVKAALRTVREAYKACDTLALNLNGQDAALAAAMPAIYRLFKRAERVYAALKAGRDALDFDDLEARAMALLAGSADVRRYWQSQIDALLVDEFQDTNARQTAFIRHLCPDSGKLFIVGDAKQSIYRFRGADVAVFADEKARIAADTGRLIDLDTSYRAHADLLAGMNRLLGPVLGEDTPSRPTWVAPFAPLTPGGKKVTGELTPPFIEFHLAVGNKAAAMPVAAAALVARLADIEAAGDLNFGDMAILCRASGSFRFYEDALDEAGIPYLTVAGKGFYERPEIRDLLNALHAVADPHDDLALFGLLRSPVCGLSDVTLYRLSAERPAHRSLWQHVRAAELAADAAEHSRLQTALALVERLNQQAGRRPVADILKQFLDATHYQAVLRRAGQLRARRNVAKLLNDVHDSGLVNVSDFLIYAQALRDSGSREGEARSTGEGVVQIMSIHAAKGLEFPLVALGDAGSGSYRSRPTLIDPALGFLLNHKDDAGNQAAAYQMGAALARQQDEAERDRLLYVALTRAEQLLLINGAVRQTRRGLSWTGWLEPLADIVGLAPAAPEIRDDGDARHVVACAVEGVPVHAAIYEPAAVPVATRPADAAAPDAAAPDAAAADAAPDSTPHIVRKPLHLPLEGVDSDGDGVESDTLAQRVWQVVPTARRPEAPAWVVGAIVHEALAAWRLPQAGFDAWVAARARAMGVSDPDQIEHAQRDAAGLLRRFRRHPRYEEIEAAERRWHELPYSYRVDGAVENGYIDLLYEKDGAWHLVDFKTDRIQYPAQVTALLEDKGYQRQLMRYGAAVHTLLGIEPQLELCWLDYQGGVRFMRVR